MSRADTRHHKIRFIRERGGQASSEAPGGGGGSVPDRSCQVTISRGGRLRISIWVRSRIRGRIGIWIQLNKSGLESSFRPLLGPWPSQDPGPHPEWVRRRPKCGMRSIYRGRTIQQIPLLKRTVPKQYQKTFSELVAGCATQRGPQQDLSEWGNVGFSYR